MSERFFIADTHFGHKGMVQFVSAGKPIRAEWGRADPDRLMSDEEAAERVEAMNEAMVERWNAVVAPGDKVEMLGDIVINRRFLPILDRLNGKKRLRSGNHDIFHKDYGKYFVEISAYKEISAKGGKGPHLLCSHIPVHPRELSRWDYNIHGHLHTERVMRTVTEVSGHGETRLEHTYEEVDPRYLCVSAEHTGFAPISMDEVWTRLAEQQQNREG